jgi:succinyl-CoA synthetase beta subunit
MDSLIKITFSDPHKQPVKVEINCRVHLCDHAVRVVVDALEKEPELKDFVMRVAGEIAVNSLLGDSRPSTDPSCN